MTSSTDQNSTRKLPKPIYAAAGAGELAMEQLRKLPGQFSELRDRAKLNERLQGVREDLREAGRKVRDLDTDKLRESAITTAAKAQERAKETYAELVTRGERVAAGERSPIRVIATIAKPEAEAPKASAEKPAADKPAAAKPAAKRTVQRARGKKGEAPSA